MYFSITTIAAFLPDLALAAPDQVAARDEYGPINSKTQFPRKCTAGVHMISLRGTSDDPADQGQPPLGGQGQCQVITDPFTGQNLRVPGSNAVGLVCPASKTPSYDASMATGRDSLKQTIADYAKRCPQIKFSLLGYSQGAQVLSNVLCTGGLDQYRHMISSAVPFGNPANVANKPYDKGTSKNNGKLGHTDCSKYTDIYRSWCDAGDTWCDAQGSSVAIHVGYMNNVAYVKEASDFIAQRAGVR